MAVPTLPDVKAYLGQSLAGRSDEVVTEALEAEKAAQRRTCRFDASNYPADLREALLRRVARNLAMKALPLGVLADESGATRLGSNDPEVRRLEAPFRKIVLG